MNTYIVSVVLVKNLVTGGSNIANSISEVKAVSEDEAKGKALTQVSKDFPDHKINTMLAVLVNANPWQQAIDDELVNAHLGIAKDEITREEAKAELNKLIAWHIDAAKYFDSQAQQEPVAEIVACYVPSGKNAVLYTQYQSLPIGTKLYAIPPAPEGGDK